MVKAAAARAGVEGRLGWLPGRGSLRGAWEPRDRHSFKEVPALRLFRPAIRCQESEG